MAILVESVACLLLNVNHSVVTIQHNVNLKWCCCFRDFVGFRKKPNRKRRYYKAQFMRAKRDAEKVKLKAQPPESAGVIGDSPGPRECNGHGTSQQSNNTVTRSGRISKARPRYDEVDLKSA